MEIGRFVKRGDSGGRSARFHAEATTGITSYISAILKAYLSLRPQLFATTIMHIIQRRYLIIFQFPSPSLPFTRNNTQRTLCIIIFTFVIIIWFIYFYIPLN